MSEVSVLSVGDVEAVVRLLGEIAGTADPIADKRRRLVGGLAGIVGADVWVWALGRYDAERRMTYLAYLDGGWSGDAQRTVAMAPECSAHVRPFEVQMVAAASVEHTTRTREQLAPDAEWYGSPLFERFRAPADLDDLLFSYYPIGRNLLSGIGLHRRLGAPRFGARERCLAHLVMSQVDWLHRAETDVPAADHVDALSARQRQVLLRLLTGQGKKQIARGLEISEHTVNDHVKALHAHFNVTSRGELLSKFIAGGGGTGAPTPTIVGVDARGVGRVSSSPKTRV